MADTMINDKMKQALKLRNMKQVDLVAKTGIDDMNIIRNARLSAKSLFLKKNPPLFYFLVCM